MALLSLYDLVYCVYYYDNKERSLTMDVNMHISTSSIPHLVKRMKHYYF